MPAATPRAIVDRLSAEIKKALAHSDVTGRFGNIALEPMFMTPEQFAALIRSEAPRWGKVVKDAKIEPE